MLQLNSNDKPINNKFNTNIIFRYLMYDIIDEIKNPAELNFIGGVYVYYMRCGRISGLQFLAMEKAYDKWYTLLGEIEQPIGDF